MLLGAQAGAVALPVCDHYSGVEARMRKSLALQAEMAEEFGACVFDVTLDCEDGAPSAARPSTRRWWPSWRWPPRPGMRVGARVHPVDHPAFAGDVDDDRRPRRPPAGHLMVPKVESRRRRARRPRRRSMPPAPTPAAACADRVAAGACTTPSTIAAHPRVQSLSFGLMDFVSAHGGAIPADGMGAAGQFTHPLVVRAKLEIASACHAHGKVPSHCVVTEFNDPDAMRAAARKAAGEFGYTRMWSIHPNQIRPDPRGLRARRAADSNRYRNHCCRAGAAWAPISYRRHIA